MKTIRHNCFETNSSSSHSLVISQGNLQTPPINHITEDNILNLYGGDFGWGYEKTNDWLDKANYCACDFEYDENKTEYLKEVLIDYLKLDDVVIDLENCYGIDHQSNGTAREELNSKNDILNFIFNPNCILILDNDNH